MVGAGAMRQVAEDASAHSAEEGSPLWPLSYFTNMLQPSSLRSAVEEVAKKFPEEERQYLTEAVMKAHQHGELDEEKLKMSWDEKSLYLFQTMKEKLDENHLRSEIKKVAKGNFPWGDYDLTEEVVKAFKNGEMDKGLKEKSQEEKQRYLLKTMREEYLRREVREVAVALKFPEESAEGREYLTEAVMRAALVQEKLKAFNFKGFEKYAKREWLRKWLRARMKQKNQDWRNLRGEVEAVARNFPKKERYDLTEAVKKAFMKGELDEEKLLKVWDRKYLVQTMQRLRELPVAASAIKFLLQFVS